MEKQPSPEQSPNNTFDTWLTGLPDAELNRIGDVTDLALKPVPPEGMADKDMTDLAHIVATAMRFRGSEIMSTDEIEDTFQSFAIQVALERSVRVGDMTREGNYSMIPSEDQARFSMTEQGKQRVEERHRNG